MGRSWRSARRGPHGYYRMDELDLSPHLRAGQNVLAIEVAGYNVNSYDTLGPAVLPAGGSSRPRQRDPGGHGK